jgi:glycosyltransferase involved in cell wall biosynthesis
MPVFNGGAYLRESLDSILGQSFGDFDLVISDNASTDGTEDICRGYSALDRRIRYIRQPRNLGATANYNTVFGEARGKYFKWASSNDKCCPGFFEKCIRVLE